MDTERKLKVLSIIVLCPGSKLKTLKNYDLGYNAKPFSSFKVL